MKYWVVTKKEEFSIYDMIKGSLPEKLVNNAFSGVQLKYVFAP